MGTKKSADTSFRDLVARLNAMSNQTPEQERAALMEAAGKAPKVLDDKEVTLADIAKLAGIKEYVEEPKVSPKAKKMVESITAPQSSISKAIAESDKDDSLAKNIKASEITEYVKKAEASDLVELYNKFSANEVEMNENEFTIKTPETAEIIADAEKAEAPEEVVQEKDAEKDEKEDEEDKEDGGINHSTTEFYF